jgi:hypothetical protein
MRRPHRSARMHSGSAGELAVKLEDAGGGVLPGELADFVVALFAQGGGEGRVAEDGEDFVGEVFGVPEIDLEDVLENFRGAALLADDDGDILGEGVEGGDAEGFADAGHDVDAGGGESFLAFFFAEKTGEVDVAFDAEGFGEVFEGVEHFALAGDDEFDVGLDGEDFFGGLQEEVGAFLLGEAAEEEDGWGARVGFGGRGSYPR